MSILGSMVVLQIDLGISILVLVVVRSLGVECFLFFVLILVLWWWSGLVMGIFRRRYLRIVVSRKGCVLVRGGGVLRSPFSRRPLREGLWVISSS